MQCNLTDCTLKTKKQIDNFLCTYVASITQHSVTMPANPSETKVFEQGRAQFTNKWKAAEFGR